MKEYFVECLQNLLSLARDLNSFYGHKNRAHIFCCSNRDNYIKVLLSKYIIGNSIKVGKFFIA